MAAINKTELFLKILITFVVRENKCEGMQWCGIVSSVREHVELEHSLIHLHTASLYHQVDE